MVQKVILLCIFAVGCISAQLQCQLRDEVAAGRNCERACRPDGTCRKQNRECICDGRCGPVCLRKTCPSLAQPGNGSLVIDPSGRFIGSEATYSCDDGFEVVGNAARICHANQTWGGSVPICQKSTAPLITTPIPATCESLPSPINGRKISVQEDGDVVENTVARFQCNDGYVRTSGNLRRICREDGSWSGSDVVCSAVVGGQCERNDQEIENQNRRCVRQCESNSNCLRGRPCVCDDICGPSCIPIDRINHCEDLSSDQSVRVRITPNNRTFGSIAQYECRNGHDVVGGSNERKCLGSGQWGGDPLTCIPRVRCDQPPEVANSAHNGTKAYYVHGDTVLYRCNFGYYRSGYLPLSRCNRDEWSEIQFQCSPKSCGDPGHVLNGRRIGASFVFLGSVEYACNPGYELRGLSRRYCQADQQWSGSLPTCHPISCPDPGVPDDGFKIGSDYSYNEIVSYDCNTRYILEGQSSIRCQANATWSAPRPTCRLIQCRRPDEPRNGRSDADLEYYGQQGTIRFDCDRGYTLRGSRVITCDEHEQWSPPPPLCLGQCSIPSCPSNGRWTIYNGGWYSNCRSNRRVDPGFRLTYRCDNDYFKCQQIEPVCNDRVWEPDTQNLCVPLGCSFVTLRDSRLTASYTYSGTHECFHSEYHQQETVIEYSCHRGYKIRDGDPSQATCQRRYWNPQQQPACVEVTCPYIQFPHGSVTYQQNGPFASNRGHTATARFNCLEGYTLEGHTLSCDNGIWNDTIPTCVEKPCYVAYLQRYNMDVQYETPAGSNDITAGRKPAGTTAHFNCRQHGFEASQTKRCERGRWAGAEPVCLKIPCDDEPLDNGVVMYTLDDVHAHEPVHGVMRSYNCNAGYTVDDDEPSQCDAGSWTKALPICNENPCSINDLPSEDWDIVYNHPERRDELAEVMKPPGTVAIFTCNRIGYVTVGMDTRTCRQGEWDGQNPPCLRSTCPSIQLENGILEYRGTNDRVTSDPRHGDSLRATCIEGYYLQGPIQRLCWEGRWQNREPFCLERPCNTNDLLVGDWDWEIQYTLDGRKEPEGSTMSPRTVATLRCNTTGYETEGRETRTCSRGEWTGQNPLCEKRTCPSIQLDNGRFRYRDSDDIVTLDPKHGDLRSVTCNTGYYRQGAAETQCWDGQWKDELPTCLEEPCNKNDLPTGDWKIEFNYPGGRNESAEVMKSPGTVARFRCNVTGYAIDGNDTRLCTLGQWDGPMMSCERSRCQTSQLVHGRLRYYDSDGTRTLTPRHGDHRIATCEGGHSLEGTSRTQCSEGEWIDELPTCQENPCSFLNETEIPGYLQVTYTERARGGRIISTSEGSVPSRGVATFTCRQEGFVLNGESQRTCKKGTWRGEFPECVIAHCSVETIHNGRVTKVNGDPFTQEASHGDSIRFSCEQGYTLAGLEISHCDAGQWIPEIPTCVEASCSAVENNGKYENMFYQGRQNPPDTSFPALTQLEVECAEGRVHEGPIVAECTRGSWDPPILLCVQAAPCEEVSQEEGRTVAYTGNSGNRKQHNSILVVTCADNMVRFGQNTSTCLNGTWSPPVSRCKENHALNKQAYQDSTDHYGSATLAVDGNIDGSYMTGRSCSHTRNDARNHWWYVDLGSSIMVTEIVLYNRQDGNQHARLLNARVRVGDHTYRYVTQNDLAGTVTDTEINPIRIEVSPAIKGRIVSVSEVTDGNPLTLCEVQVFGEVPACADGCEVPPLEHGYFTMENDPRDTPLQTKACVTSARYIYAHCQEGWTHQERFNFYTCQQSEEWFNRQEGDITCQPCPRGECVVPYIENGHFESSRDGTTLANGTCIGNEYFRVVCDAGMQRNGSEYYLCSSGLIQTRNTANVITSCSKGSLCQNTECVVPSIENGHYSLTRDGSALEEGTCVQDRRNLYVSCDDGTQLHGPFFYQCNGGELLVSSSCSRVSNEQEQGCPNPGEANLVETFVGSDFAPLNEQEIFREGDFITSRCQDPKRQKFRGSVTRFCEGGVWSGDPAECESTNFVFSVGNTVIQNVTENGTIIVYPVRGYVKIICNFNGLPGAITMHKNQGRSSVTVGIGRNRLSHRINDPSQSNSGTYRCVSNRRSHSITVLFKAIRCPPPSQPRNWDHNRRTANSDGSLGYIFTEGLSLRCQPGYTSSNPAPNNCTYHGTWSNMSQRCIRY